MTLPFNLPEDGFSFQPWKLDSLRIEALEEFWKGLSVNAASSYIL
jgi:hypothetical protein